MATVDVSSLKWTCRHVNSELTQAEITESTIHLLTFPTISSASEQEVIPTPPETQTVQTEISSAAGKPGIPALK